MVCTIPDDHWWAPGLGELLKVDANLPGIVEVRQQRGQRKRHRKHAQLPELCKVDKRSSSEECEIDVIDQNVSEK